MYLSCLKSLYIKPLNQYRLKASSREGFDSHLVLALAENLKNLGQMSLCLALIGHLLPEGQTIASPYDDSGILHRQYERFQSPSENRAQQLA